jgi:hypothetical protein
MSVNKEKMISYLAERYPGDLQTRGLWLWAEGESKDIPYIGSPEENWIELWALTEKDDTHIEPMNLIQEALMDDPGDEFLIDCLRALSKNTSGTIKNNARLLVEILEHWNSELELESMRAVLLMLFDCSVREGVTVLIPVLNCKIDEELCDKWEPWFQNLKKEKQTSYVKGTYNLLNLMLGSLMENLSKKDSQKFHTSALKVKAYLEKVLKGIETIPENVKAQDPITDLGKLIDVTPKDNLLLDSLIKELMPLIASFVEINPKNSNPISNTAINGIQRFFKLSKFILEEDKWPKVTNSAEICFKSIWATKGKKSER